MDYKELGLKIGFEIHQQLDTKTKLFCKCPARLIKGKEPDIVITRIFRAVKGELERIDIAVKFEEFKKREVIYYVWNDVDCLVDIDEEPPHEINKEALKEVLKIAKFLNCYIPEELHVMRKTIIDGSLPSGFQRTMLVGLNGYIEIEGKKIGIGTICLEEDSGKKIGEKDGKIIFALDRLGIPLVEIRTDPDINDPKEARKVAEYLGLILRSFKIKRGIGTIRQDVNVSIRGGNRVEIKGVQDLDLIPKIIELEVIRQLNLLKIREELLKRGLRKEEIEREEIKEITDIFKDTKSKIIRKSIENGGVVFGLRLPKFKGLIGFEIQPNRRLGTEFADIAKKFGLGGIFHSDELPKYGISEEEVEKIRESLNCSREDGFAIICGDKEKCLRAMEIIKERAKQCLDGVPKEVRKVNPDGTTSFLRPLPGAARMYPETDLLPIKTEKYLKEIEKEKIELIFEKIERFEKEFGLKKEILKKLLRMGVEDILEYGAKELRIKPTILSNLILGLKTNIRKDFSEEIEIDSKILKICVESLGKGEITKDMFHVLYYRLYCGENLKDILREIRKIDIGEIEGEIKELLEKLKDKKKVFTEIMKKYKGRIDGKELMELLTSL